VTVSKRITACGLSGCGQRPEVALESEKRLVDGLEAAGYEVMNKVK
jgi:hypothetical protein